MNGSEVQQRMRHEGTVTEPLSPAELAQLIDKERRVWRPVVEKIGLLAR